MPEKRPLSRSSQRGPQRSGRRPAPAPKPTPAWMKIGLIVGPLVLVALVGRLYYVANKTPVVEEKVVVNDPNKRIKELQKEVPVFLSELQKVHSAKDSATKKRLGNALTARVEKWSGEWDEIFNARRDKNDRLPPELQVYSKDRSAVQQLRLDLMKIMEF